MDRATVPFRVTLTVLRSMFQLEQLKRRKRSFSHHRSERSAELGVESGYEVVSEADLAFSPEDEDLNVAVLKVLCPYSSL